LFDTSDVRESVEHAVERLDAHFGLPQLSTSKAENDPHERPLPGSGSSPIDSCCQPLHTCHPPRPGIRTDVPSSTVSGGNTMTRSPSIRPATTFSRPFVPVPEDDVARDAIASAMAVEILARLRSSAYLRFLVYVRVIPGSVSSRCAVWLGARDRGSSSPYYSRVERRHKQPWSGLVLVCSVYPPTKVVGGLMTAATTPTPG
jgi:hypothetical protein